MPIYAKSAKEGEEKERLAEHTIKDIQAGRVLVKNLPFGKDKKKRIGTDLDETIAFHDVGKAASGFQASLEKGAPKWGRRHEIPSAVAAKSAGVEDVVAFAIITHHKTILSDGLVKHGCLEDRQLPYRNHIYPVWNKIAEEWKSNIDELEEEWHKICVFLNRKDLLSKRLNLNTPLSDSMMHWLHRDIQPKCFSFKQREYASLLRGLTMSADHIMSTGSNMPVRIPILNEYNVTPHTLYSYQTRVGKRKGSVLLQAPTGSGKTEAAIKWAQNNQKRNGRLFYALPTTASINAMYLRIKESFHDTDNTLVGLLHSRTRSSLYSLFEEDNDLSSRDISLSNQASATTLSSLVREMYFPIRVCTPHQILRYSLQGKGWESMLSEFPNSCFIFDEIHAYNARLMGLTMATVRYLVSKNATCMFLTATLPRFIRKFIEHEIPDIHFMKPSYQSASDRRILEQKRHILERPVDGDILSNVDLIVRESDKVNSTLVICNHVSTAQQVYRKLRRGKVKDTVLLHSRFTRRDRNEIENNLMHSKLNPNDESFKALPRILVSTQAIEVSLDLDFEQGFTEPAPIDAIVQRLGRINRYAARPPTLVRIFTKQLNKDNRVYSKALRDKSLEVLSSLSNPLGEEDLNEAANRVYGECYNPDDQDDYQKGLNYEELKHFKKCLIAGTDQYWIDEVIDEKEGSIDLLPESLVEEYSILKRQGLIIKANNLIVPVGKWMLPFLLQDNRIDKSQDPWVLTDCRYTKELGLEVEDRPSSVVI